MRRQGLIHSFIVLALAAVPLTGAKEVSLRVAAMHPIMGDLARQVGGDKVEVIDLLPLHLSIHHFDPTPDVLKDASKAHIVLASGKHLELGWIEKVRSNLPQGTEIIEVGRTIPSLLIDTTDEMFICCPDHSAGSLDPHWWHSIKNMQRATRIVRDILAKKDPLNKAYYQTQAKAYEKQLNELHSWVRKQVAKIPRADRELATAHLAFAYLCKEYGFRAIPLLGLNQEQSPSPLELGKTINHIKKYSVRAVFPEVRANPKSLKVIAKETGIRIGNPLLADGVTIDYPTYEQMVRYNFQTILQGITGEK